jgi:hypothetical protein
VADALDGARGGRVARVLDSRLRHKEARGCPRCSRCSPTQAARAGSCSRRS